MKYFDRLIDKSLLKWINNTNNKQPLILNGIRQVGKTTSILEFANTYFDETYIYINPNDNVEIINKLLQKNKIIDLMKEINELFNTKLDDEWLLIFDCIEDYTKILNCLKQYNSTNNLPQIVCVGNFNQEQLSIYQDFFEIQTMYGFTFYEFLMALDKDILSIRTQDYNLTQQELEKIFNLWEHFIIIGNLPEIIHNYVNYPEFLYNKTNATNNINNIQNNAFINHINDINMQITNRIERNKGLLIFDNIIKFVGMENNTFTFSTIDKNARFRDYKNTINLLLNTNLIIKANCVKDIYHPSSSYIDSKFKLFYENFGFISYLLSDINIFNFFESNDNKCNCYKESMAINFIYSELYKKGNKLYFYKYIVDGVSYEVSLILRDINNNTIPVFVSLNKNIKKNIITFLKKHQNINVVIFLTSSNCEIFKYENKEIIILPIFIISFFEINDQKIDVDLIKWKITKKIIS